MLNEFPNDLLIFSPLILINPQWDQYFAKGFPVKASLCAISFSWWGNIKSFPPPWISIVSPRFFKTIVEHSICHPGLPSPQGDFHEISPGFAAFHKAKSIGSCFPSSTSFLTPFKSSSTFLCDNFPYPGKLLTLK